MLYSEMCAWREEDFLAAIRYLGRFSVNVNMRKHKDWYPYVSEMWAHTRARQRLFYNESNIVNIFAEILTYDCAKIHIRSNN